MLRTLSFARSAKARNARLRLLVSYTGASSRRGAGEKNEGQSVNACSLGVAAAFVWTPSSSGDASEQRCEAWRPKTWLRSIPQKAVQQSRRATTAKN